jgi:hypothetical protein
MSGKNRQETLEEIMLETKEKVGARTSNREVGQLVLDLLGECMSLLTNEKSSVDAVGVIFALGMTANSVATLLADQSEGEMGVDESKSEAMKIFTFAMRQTVVARKADGPEGTLFKNLGPVVKH